MSKQIRNATWRDWPHVGYAYRVRNRGGTSWFSVDGFVWTDSFGVLIDEGQLKNVAIRLHGGARDGEMTP